MCIGWVPLVPCSNVQTQTAPETSRESARGRGEIVGGKWRLPVRYQTPHSLSEYVLPEVLAAFQTPKPLPKPVCLALNLHVLNAPCARASANCISASRYSIYLLYQYKSTNADAPLQIAPAPQMRRVQSSTLQTLPRAQEQGTRTIARPPSIYSKSRNCRYQPCRRQQGTH